MCVGVTVSLAPPTALVSGYYLWHCGQNFALSSSWLPHVNRQKMTSSTKMIHTGDVHVLEPPPQSIMSYLTGIATLSGSYLVLDHCIHKWEVSSSSSPARTVARSNNTQQRTGSSSSSALSSTNNTIIQKDSKYFLPHKASPSQMFRPPQTVKELMERLGPPLLSRLGAASFSFFCAGAVQTYVASYLQ